MDPRQFGRTRVGVLATAAAVATFGALAGGAAVQASAATPVAPVCATKATFHINAPAVTQSATFSVSTPGSVGSVTLLRPTTTTLSVTSATPVSPWKATVVVPSGARVHVMFVNKPKQDRWYARLNAAGTRIDIVEVDCT
jgi:hypothetical protein